MIKIRKSDQRGHANFGWLDTKHTFSFGQYYDEDQMGFSALRVINDDTIKADSGFDTHGHRNMEIITLVLSGAIRHKDSEGNVSELPAGEFQLMSAGRGIYHSEYNASSEQELHLLQIWIEPNINDTEPSYQQKAFSKEKGLTLIATPEGEGETLTIKQDARLYYLSLLPDMELELANIKSRKLYVHQIAGQLTLEESLLSTGDGAKIENHEQVIFRNQAKEPVIALVFDLP